MSRSYRSLFWPILLLGVGVVWLLSNLGYITPVNWVSLLRLWPVLLIVAGLDLLFGRTSSVLGGLIGLLAVAFIVFMLVAGPGLGVTRAPELIRDHFTEPVGEATSATVSLALGSTPSRVYALDEASDELFDATIEHFGQASFTASGEQTKTVRLSLNPAGVNWLDTLGAPARRWEIGLSRRIPLDLTINSGSGSVSLDLEGLLLDRLSVDSGSGSIQVRLPDTPGPYQAHMESGSGSVRVDVPCSAGIALHVDGGSGSQNLDVPNDCPLRVEVRDSGSGSIRLPGNLERVEGRAGQDQGVWQSSDYETSRPHVWIVLDGHGSGSFNLE